MAAHGITHERYRAADADLARSAEGRSAWPGAFAHVDVIDQALAARSAFGTATVSEVMAPLPNA